MVTHTPVSAFMDMTILQFYEFNNATCEVLRMQREARS